MDNNQKIFYLPHQQIDKEKWDNCISASSNGLIYAYSFYLDNMAKHWDALIICNSTPQESKYDFVMPLTWNKKYFIYYLYQPFLTAQLGVFGKDVNEAISKEFINAIPSKFRYWDISLNTRNFGDFTFYKRSNYILPLHLPYSEIYAGYNENIKRNIRKMEQASCSIEKGFDVEVVIKLALLQMQEYTKQSTVNTNNFRCLYKILQQKNMVATYGIKLNNEWLASCVFFYSHSRAYYILVGNHPNGKMVGASHALIDAFIKDHAGKKILLDFEGSDIPGLALFYSSFGAKEEPYPAIRKNNLPLMLRWLKR